MGNWLQNILTPPKPPANRGHLPVRSSGSNHLPAHPYKPGIQLQKGLPNATVIYGIGASLMFVASFSLLLLGRFFPAFLVFIIGGLLTGFALHFLKHQD